MLKNKINLMFLLNTSKYTKNLKLKKKFFFKRLFFIFFLKKIFNKKRKKKFLRGFIAECDSSYYDYNYIFIKKKIEKLFSFFIKYSLLLKHIINSFILNKCIFFFFYIFLKKKINNFLHYNFFFFEFDSLSKGYISFYKIYTKKATKYSLAFFYKKLKFFNLTYRFNSFAGLLFLTNLNFFLNYFISYNIDIINLFKITNNVINNKLLKKNIYNINLIFFKKRFLLLSLFLSK